MLLTIDLMDSLYLVSGKAKWQIRLKTEGEGTEHGKTFVSIERKPQIKTLFTGIGRGQN